MSKEFENLNKEQLIKYIEDLRRQLNNEKFGIYFDRKATPEDNVELCKKNVPIFVRKQELDIIKGTSDNFLIEGDNFPVLTSLATISPSNGLVDIIYIDPPYNTGNEDFTYNDKFVDQEDGYRHTKWLNFMEKRLKLARQIMKNDAVLFISIDDNEHPQLRLLCNSIFGEENCVGEIIWISNPNGRGDDEYIGRIHEYVLVYRKTNQLVFNTEPQNLAQFNLKDEKGIYAEQILYSKLSYSKGMDYVVTAPDGTSIYAGGSKKAWELRQSGRNTKKDYTWRWSESKLLAALETGEAIIKKVKDEWKVYRKRRPTDEGAPYKGFYSDEGTRHGTKQIKEVFNSQPFDHPKPTGLIKYLISLKPGDNNFVCDFFAGSGTTAQAVLELNAEKKLSNRFLLCTNNERQIMTNVCYPRIKTIITGIRIDNTKYSDGESANLYFLKSDLSPTDSSKDQVKYELAQRIDPMLCLLESTMTETINRDKYSVYTDANKSKLTIIYRDFYSENDYKEICAIVESNPSIPVTVYHFSVSNLVQNNVFDKYKNVVSKPFPSKIYDIFKNIIDDVKREY